MLGAESWLLRFSSSCEAKLHQTHDCCLCVRVCVRADA